MGAEREDRAGGDDLAVAHADVLAGQPRDFHATCVGSAACALPPRRCGGGVVTRSHEVLSSSRGPAGTTTARPPMTLECGFAGVVPRRTGHAMDGALAAVITVVFRVA